jgi:2-O-(6-phospho-alpha-D-mannosyl)-D-glycerate hydrolase
MRAFLVSHTHWDREWYRTHQEFRARLVDAVDRVLDLCAGDPGYRFLLDGQSIALEDYAAIRPGRVAELCALVAAGRIAIGPWYVQPDSFLPAGESHVRNLLEGRRAGEAFGPVSRVAYTPDSFGHPAQFPQLLAGFGLSAFVYWRGHGNEIETLPPEYDWVAPDGTSLLACHLGKGYFAAATDPRADAESAASRIAGAAKELAARTRSRALLLMNGIDHALPEPKTAAIAEATSRATGFSVERALLEDFVAAVEQADAERPRFAGELGGARVAHLLPGVWSTRSWIKLANRACEAELLGYAEPLAALSEALGAPSEGPALRLAWRTLLPNHAHDSICGCSRDEVHDAMRARFEDARELARETAARCLARLAGGGVERSTPWSDAFEVAVWNPSPHPRSGLVRFPLDPHPWMIPATNPVESIHPLLLRDLAAASFSADGAPARLVPAAPGRVKLVPERAGYDVEFVVGEVPACGWRRVALRCHEGWSPDRVETVVPGSAEAVVCAGDVRIEARADGCVNVAFGGRRFEGLFAVEDVGDRGDSYDFDCAGSDETRLATVTVERFSHPAGVVGLRIERRLSLPRGLAEDREARSRERVELRLWLELQIAPGAERVDARVVLDNSAEDHRLRLLFPVGAGSTHCEAATTFDVSERRSETPDDSAWVQRAVASFVSQGFVHAGGLSVVAPGLSEAEWVQGPSGAAIAFTLLRAVGHLSRLDLRSRRGPAGPGTDTPGAQCPGRLEARLALFAGLDPSAARDAELPLRAVPAGAVPLAEPGRALLALEPCALLLSAVKPAERGAGLVVRVLNPTAAAQTATLRLGFPFARAESVRLDETASGDPLAREGDLLRFALPPHALRSVWVE